MKLFKNKKITFLLAFLFFSIVGLQQFVAEDTAWAQAVCGRNTSHNSECDTSNRNASGLSEREFKTARDACEGTDSLLEGTSIREGTIVWVFDTNTGNCSNAIRACMESAQDKRACQDGEVLAFISQCNEGNVGAGRTQGGAIRRGSLGGNNAGCGVDNAIDRRNAVEDGDDYETNDGFQKRYIDEQKAKCQTDITNCEKLTEQQINDCYNEKGLLTNGYPTKRANPAVLNDCLMKKSTTPEQCKERGGVWDSGIKKCDNPNPPSSNDDEDQTPGECPRDPKTGQCNSGSSVDGECGQARVNLLVCEGDGTAAMNDVLRIVIAILSVCIGVAAVGGLAWASVLYAKAEDNAASVGEARELIRNIVVGILLYGFLVAIINWLVPGGVIGT